MTAADIRRTILAVWRIEQPRLITGLSRMLRDVTLAEDLTQDALVAALEHWPLTGVPEKPGAWLMATAKRRALDDLRPDDGRDRARLPAAGGDHRPAHRARQADAVRIRARLRNPARRRTLGTAGLGAGGRLSHLQRRLYGGAR